MDESKSPGAGDRYWGSRAGFILASLGSAAGLGNIRRFAYVAGENGGGAFFFVYLACVLMIGLPQIFLVMPGGELVAVAFFALLVTGALTSMVSVLEVPVARLRRKTGWDRPRLAVPIAAVSLAVGLPSTLGFGVLSDIVWHGRGIMGNLDYLVSNLLLPLGGILVALEVGWHWRRKQARRVAFANDGFIARLWHWFLRFVVPVLIAIIIAIGPVAA